MINDIKDLLIVKDNFFNEDIYKKILIDLSTLNFFNRNNYISEKHRNIYQKIYFMVDLNPKHFAVVEVEKILSNYGFDICGIEHNYFLSSKHEEATPHNDAGADLNCLVYLKGNEIINSGTGFYDKKENQYVLNRHIGFKENRAIIFDSKIFHSSLQFNEGAEKRYVMTNFFKYKKN